MELSTILQKFMERSPIPVMVQALLERILSMEQLNACFARASNKQYTRALLFSSVFELMSLVVFKAFSSIHVAYQAQKGQIGVSLTSVYNKLNGLEPAILTALVRDTAEEMAALIRQLNGTCQPLLPGYRALIMDGNCLAATDRRLAVVRDQSGGPLPGKSLVVYDPALEMVIDVFPCTDGHEQERTIAQQLLPRVQARDVLIMDRHFCVRRFLADMASRGGYFICRHHKQVVYQALGAQQEFGACETGTVSEQWIEVAIGQAVPATWRAVTLKLYKPTRDGDREIVILTNLPPSAADAMRIAELYRKRWNIETMFQQLESYLRSEINTLGYPQAALFGFCVALIAYNVMAVVKAALRQEHGEEKVRDEVSAFYIAGEITRTHEGMQIAIEPHEWGVFQAMTQESFVATLMQLAHNVKLEKYKKHRRGPKKPTPARTSSRGNHVATARLLAKAKSSP
jgi:hypothetical protein